MKKIILYVIIFNIISFFVSYAKPYNAYNIEKSIGMTMKECHISDDITSYDYTKLNEKKRLDDAVNFLLYPVNPMNEYNIIISDDRASQTSKCSRFHYEFYDYLFESLMSIEDNNIKNSAKYNTALFYYYFDKKNRFYELEKLLHYAKKLSNVSKKEFIEIFSIKDDSNKEYKLKYINNLYKVIKFLNDEKNTTNNYNAGVFYNKLVDAYLDNFSLLEIGRADIFNCGIDMFFTSEIQGSGLFNVIAVDFSAIDINKLSDYLKNNSINFKNNPREINKFYESFSSSYDYKFAVFPYNKNVYIIDINPLNSKLYDMYFFTFNNFYKHRDNFYGKRNNTHPNLFLTSGTKTNNFPLGDIRHLNIEKVTNILNDEVEKASSFAKNGEYDVYLATDYYINYVESVAGQYGYAPSDYYSFDIDNDGKDELLGVITISSSTYYNEGTYTYVLDNKTLKIEDNVLNKFLQSFTAQEDNMADKKKVALFKSHKINNKITKDNVGNGIKCDFKQKLYTHNGKNKILLYENQCTGVYIDILYKNGKLNITADSLYKYDYNINLLWKGKIVNGNPVDILKLNNDIMK